MITKQTSKLVRLYKHYDKGVMLHAGGVLEQSNFYLEAMEVIEKSINN